jgi:hypothetical protein
MRRERCWLSDLGMLFLIFYVVMLGIRIFFPATWQELNRCNRMEISK